MQFASNPSYTTAYVSDSGIAFYMPIDVSDYHKIRELAMQAQDAYNRCGISRDALQSLTNKMLEIANMQGDMGTVRTDIGVLANNLNYRMSQIADEQCILTMAALGLFLEGEDPNDVQAGWTNKKMQMAKEYPDVRAFFLQMGIAFTPEYAKALRGLAIEGYLAERAMLIGVLTLPITPA